MSSPHSADPVSGVKNVPPAYPVRPVQPGPQERRSGQRQKGPNKDEMASEKRRNTPLPDRADDADEDSASSIDEYV